MLQLETTTMAGSSTFDGGWCYQVTVIPPTAPYQRSTELQAVRVKNPRGVFPAGKPYGNRIQTSQCKARGRFHPMGCARSVFYKAASIAHLDVAPSFPPLTHLFSMSVRDHDSDPSHKASEFVTDKADAELDNGPTQHSLQRQLKNRHVAMIRYFSSNFYSQLLASIR